MALMKVVENTVFDISMIKPGDLILVESEYWHKQRSGIVMYVSPEKIIFIYHPDISNVTNRQVLTATDMKSGMYTVRWSSDLVTVNEYKPEGGEDD